MCRRACACMCKYATPPPSSAVQVSVKRLENHSSIREASRTLSHFLCAHLTAERRCSLAAGQVFFFFFSFGCCLKVEAQPINLDRLLSHQLSLRPSSRHLQTSWSTFGHPDRCLQLPTPLPSPQCPSSELVRPSGWINPGYSRREAPTF